MSQWSHLDQECPSTGWPRVARAPSFHSLYTRCCSNNEDGFVLHDADDTDRIEFIENKSSQGSVVQDFLELCGDASTLLPNSFHSFIQSNLSFSLMLWLINLSLTNQNS